MITIFTPIYNRAYIIGNLYQSLLRQTCFDFEWLIVDDGSTDNIGILVDEWIKSNQQFKIRLYHQENKGKHAAINYGVKLAKYEGFFIVDSDDYLEDDAVEIIMRYWKEVYLDKTFAGIAGLRRNDDGKVIGGIPLFEEYVDASNLERENFGLDGDKAEIYKTELLRRLPFPEYEGEKFVTEAVVWDRLAYEGYKIRWINKNFVVCDYLEDGLTARGNSIFTDNPKGWAHHLKTRRHYRAIDTNEWLRNCYYYYECEITRFTKDEIKKMLDMDTSEIEMVTTQYVEFACKLTEICAHKKIAIYGYGIWGKRIKKYLSYLQSKVEYVIDKRWKEIDDVTAYSIEMELPEVDLVFIALYTGAEMVAEAVKNKIQNVQVIVCKDIIPELW